MPGHIRYMPLEGQNKSQLKRSLIFLGHPLYYNGLNTLTYKQESRRSSTLKQEVKKRRVNTARVLWAYIFQCCLKQLSLMLLSVV